MVLKVMGVIFGIHFVLCEENGHYIYIYIQCWSVAPMVVANGIVGVVVGGLQYVSAAL